MIIRKKQGLRHAFKRRGDQFSNSIYFNGESLISVKTTTMVVGKRRILTILLKQENGHVVLSATWSVPLTSNKIVHDKDFVNYRETFHQFSNTHLLARTADLLIGNTYSSLPAGARVLNWMEVVCAFNYIEWPQQKAVNLGSQYYNKQHFFFFSEFFKSFKSSDSLFVYSWVIETQKLLFFLVSLVFNLYY